MTTNELVCRDIVELITAYLEGNLPANQRMRFEEHLRECEYCQLYLAQMRETVRLIGRMPEEPLTERARRELERLFRDWSQS